jgi:hypothetical protein
VITKPALPRFIPPEKIEEITASLTQTLEPATREVASESAAALPDIREAASGCPEAIFEANLR